LRYIILVTCNSVLFHNFGASAPLILCSAWEGMAFAHTKSNSKKYCIATPCND
jgi:hypothetical protein